MKNETSSVLCAVGNDIGADVVRCLTHTKKEQDRQRRKELYLETLKQHELKEGRQPNSEPQTRAEEGKEALTVVGGELLTVNTAERVGGGAGGGAGGAGGGMRDRVDRVMNPLPSTEIMPSGYVASESGRGGMPVSAKEREVVLKAQQVSVWECACMCMCVWACACMCMCAWACACMCMWYPKGWTRSLKTSNE